MPKDEQRAAILQLYRNQVISVAERDVLLEQLALEDDDEEVDNLSAETVLQVMRRLLGVEKSEAQLEKYAALDEKSHLTVPIVKSDAEKGQVFGFAMFAEDPEHPGEIHIDKQGDMITPEDLEDAVYDFVLDSRDGGVMHVTKGDATLIESVVFTPEKLEAMGLAKDAMPNGAWWLGYQVHNEEARELVKSGKLSAFSIEGAARREEVDNA